jgi:hypothetical protein
MNLSAVASRFAHNARAIRAMIEGCGDAQLRWKPDAAIWSMLEVLCHLADEEELDFRVRLDYTLHLPGQQWPTIDPPEWVIERAYNEQDPAESLQRFLSQREQNIAWLRHLEHPDWDAAYEHPAIGRMTARDIITSWQAHDLLHLRQLARLHFLWLERQSPDARTDYAGRW